jgi:DNA polymerase-1
MLRGLIKMYKPSSVVVAFDGGTPQFRKELLPQYKAHRKKDDNIDWDDVHRQMDFLASYAFPVHGVQVLKMPGIEADDLMAQAAYLAYDRPYIVTTDDDLLQCISSKVSVLSPIKGKIYTEDNFEEEFGFRQEYYITYKLLIGDGSDNVPGVPGIGEKTATRLIKALQNNNNGPLDMESALEYTKILNHKQLNNLDIAYNNGTLETLYDVIDLSLDRCDVRRRILKSGWSKAVNHAIKSLYMQNGMVSLLEGEIIRLFTKLVKPPYFIERCPLVDIGRNPWK